MLKQGVAAWNQWRNAHPKVRPDLSVADLRGMDLGDVDFSGANLSAVDLREANLS